jgi:hypothetical protein
MLNTTITKTHECLELAASEGYKYAGLYNTKYCFGSNDNPLSEGEAQDCDAVCDTVGEECGGTLASNSIYELYYD